MSIDPTPGSFPVTQSTMTDRLLEPATCPPRRIVPLPLGIAICLGLGGCHLDGSPGRLATPSPIPAIEHAVDAPEAAYDAVRIFPPTEPWCLTIRTNGSAVYEFGDGSPEQSASVPQATFTFAEVLARALAVSKEMSAAEVAAVLKENSERAWYSVSLARPRVSQTEMRHTRDPAFGKDLFDKAIAASRPGPTLIRLLQTRPPFPGIATTQPSPTTRPSSSPERP